MRSEMQEHIEKFENDLIALAISYHCESNRRDQYIKILSKGTHVGYLLKIRAHLGVLILENKGNDMYTPCFNDEFLKDMVTMLERCAENIGAGAVYLSGFNGDLEKLEAHGYLSWKVEDYLSKELIAGTIDRMDEHWSVFKQTLIRLHHDVPQFELPNIEEESEHEYWNDNQFYYSGFHGRMSFNWFDGEYEVYNSPYHNSETDKPIFYYAKNEEELWDVITKDLLPKIKLNRRLLDLFEPPCYFFDKLFSDLNRELKKNIKATLNQWHPAEELEDNLWKVLRKSNMLEMTSHIENQVTLYRVETMNVYFIVDRNDNNRFYAFNSNQAQEACDAFIQLSLYDIENRVKDRIQGFMKLTK